MYRWGQEEADAVARVITSGRWSRYLGSKGNETEAVKFEKEWTQAMGVKEACLVSSGTGALICCCAGLQIGPGDEVIMPGYTFMATALAPIAVGAIPIIVDIDDSLMIDPDAIEAAITPRTKAIIPVHMDGFACDMDRIMDIAKKHNLLVLEDSCQCVGGHWHDGRRTGAIGDMGAFSFNQYKVISCGEGGLFVTNNREAHVRGVIYHDGGVYFREHADQLGMEVFCGASFRASEISGAMMRVQFGRLEGIISDLHRVRKEVIEAVGDSAGLVPIRHNGGMATGTGATLGYRFETPEGAKAFANELGESQTRVESIIPIDSGKHVYENWEPILTQKGSYSEKTNAFANPLNVNALPKYSTDMLPRTLEILKTTVFIRMNPDWTAVETASVAETIKKAATKVESCCATA